MAKIFISYKRNDKEVVLPIVNRIQQELNVECWMDISGIESHAQFVSVIIKAIDEAEVFLFMYSKSHQGIEDYEKDWTIRELNYAQERKKRIVFINIDGTELINWFVFMFPQKQQVDAQSGEEMAKLTKDILKWLSPVHNFIAPVFSFRLSEDNNMFFVTVNNIPFRYIKVKSGVFVMGATKEMRNPSEEEYPIHTVELSRDFYIGETLVTQEFWEMIMGNNPSWFKGKQRPVDSVSYYDVNNFIRRLYSYTNLRFRLPYEAEWEFSARGGIYAKSTRFIGGTHVQNVAWFNGNSKKQSHDVKLKSPNELGLYDMGGNVGECCKDFYSKYDDFPQIDPHGPSSGSSRVIRGGSWSMGTRGCRASYRDKCSPRKRGYDIGFRLVLDLNEDK